MRHIATKFICHHYRAHILGPMSHSYQARVLQLQKPMCLEILLHSKRSHCNEKYQNFNEE